MEMTIKNGDLPMGHCLAFEISKEWHVRGRFYFCISKLLFVPFVTKTACNKVGDLLVSIVFVSKQGGTDSIDDLCMMESHAPQSRRFRSLNERISIM